jgi:hypothetical protein
MAIIPGETNQNFTATDNGNYAVEITKNTCVDTSICYEVTGLGILENSFGDRLIMFPNPTKGNVSINLGAIYPLTKVTITDINGKKINSNTYKNTSELNFELDQPNGIYFLVISSANKKAVIRVIKE